MIPILLLSLLSQTPVKVLNNKADVSAVATRCVNASGTAFESCGGSGSSSWFPDGGVIGIVNQGTSPWVSNVTQYGSTNISTGTGVSGLGIPRFTVSSDSSLTCNAGTNLNTSALALDATLTNRTLKAVVTDGTRDVTVKAASTAAIATDTALVCAISPNNTVAVTQSTSPWVTSLASTTITGSVTVAQATGTNLHAVIDTGSTTACTQATGTNLHVVTDATSVLAANQSINVSQINAVTPLMGNGVTGTGSQRVTIASDNTAFSVNAAQSGTWTDRVVGNAGAALDAANNAAAPANVLVLGAQLQSSASATVGTAGQVGSVVAGLDHVLYAREGGPVLFSGGVTAIGATLTQVVAAPAAGLSLYVTDIDAVSDTATAGQMTLRYGTGANCATGTTTFWPNVASITTGKYPYPANTAANPSIYNFSTSLKVPAANALCVICVATNTCTVTIHGYTAP